MTTVAGKSIPFLKVKVMSRPRVLSVDNRVKKVCWWPGDNLEFHSLLWMC